MKNSTKGIIYAILCLVIIGAVIAVIYSAAPKNELAYDEFMERMVKVDDEVFGKTADKPDGEEISIVADNFVAKITVGKANLFRSNVYTVNITSRDGFKEQLVGADGKGGINAERAALGLKKISFKYNDPNSGSIWNTVMLVGGFVIVLALGLYAFRQMNNNNRQSMNFGKSKARVNENIKIRFNDVAGAEEEKEELAEIVEFLKSPQKFSSVGARIPKGVLLVGQPGTGKTLFAKAIAGEANVPFFSISGSDFVEMYVGVGASRVRDLFDQAKRHMPCIIFIDEIDAVGRQRGTGLGGGHDEREQTLNQLLVQMDGFETNDGIIVMAATNRADILDPALLRPGRFDRQIYINPPDVRGREAIFKVHSRNKPIGPDVDFKILARMTTHFTGADIENLLNEAAILCARDNRKIISMKDVSEGINKVIMGPQKKSRLVTEYDKRITAYHEAGHAIVAKVIPECDPVHEVSIIPRGGAAGYTLMRPGTDDNHVSKEKLIADISMGMGGRAAEEIFIKSVSTGASQDIKQSTAIARKMVTEWGMSELGPIFMGTGHEEVFLGRDFSQNTQYSESITSKIDAAVSKFVDEGHAKALSILKANTAKTELMVRLLLERETIYSDEVDMIMEGKTLDEINEYIDKKNNSKKVPYTDNLPN